MAIGKLIFIKQDLFIKTKFQLRFIFKFCLLVLTGGILSTGLIFYFSRGTLTASFHESRLVLRDTSIAVLSSAIYTNLITFAVIFLVTIAVMFYLARNIIMPMLRFEEDLKAIAEGDLTTKIGYREKDQTTGLGQNLNIMTESLNGKVRDIQTGFKKVVEAASMEDVPDRFAIDLIRLHRRIGRGFKL